MANALTGFAAKARRLSDDMPALERRVVERGALIVKNAVLTEMRAAVGADLRMSGVGRKGAKIGARYDKGNRPSTAVVRATGPAHLIERSTRPHDVPRARARGRRLIAIPGVGVRASARHPGTRGRRPWARGLAGSVPKIPAVLRDEAAAELRKHFRG
jgi:hypothetical protein